MRALLVLACLAGGLRPPTPAVTAKAMAYDPQRKCIKVELHNGTADLLLAMDLRFRFRGPDGAEIGQATYTGSLGKPRPPGATWTDCVVARATATDRAKKTKIAAIEVEVTRIAASDAWQPAPADLEALEKALAPHLRQHYFRKYSGTLEGKRRVIHVRLECRELAENEAVMGGGDCYGYATYDVERGKITDLRWNSAR